jgi:PAS domain S-box-containing protein
MGPIDKKDYIATALRKLQLLGSVKCPMTTVTSEQFPRTPSEARVLLVGASPTAVTNRACLSAVGYDVQLERAGGAALAALDQAPYDLIVIDWELPDGHGVELCRAIRARPRHADPYVIALIPNCQPGPVQALEAGADDYLIIPFEEVQLLHRAQMGLRSAQLHISETQLRTLMTNVPGAIYRCANDAYWTMELISDDIERISGYPPSDFIGNACRTLASVIHPYDRDRVQHDVTQATQLGKLFSLEYRIVRADDSVAWVLERGQQVHGSNNRSWLDGVIFDISERRRIEDELQQSLRQLAVAEDRQRIARELHDGVIQSLFGVGMTLQTANLVTDQPDTIRACLATSMNSIDSVIEDVRNYVFQLRPGLLVDRQLHMAIDQLAKDFQSISGVVTVVDVDSSVATALAPRAEDIVQLAREALSNVRRHARATTCRVSLKRIEGTALLEIDDDGDGFEPIAAAHSGQGLRNLAERSASLDGRLTIDSGATGTTVTVRLPL